MNVENIPGVRMQLLRNRGDKEEGVIEKVWIMIFGVSLYQTESSFAVFLSLRHHIPKDSNHYLDISFIDTQLTQERQHNNWKGTE